jgi:hypothetical protein
LVQPVRPSLELYEPEATFVWPDGRSATGHAAIREALGPLIAAAAGAARL